jgi:hypothetical protein
MATTINFYRPNRKYRMVFREGRFLLNTEAGELQLEVLQALREHIKSVFGPAVAVANAYKVEVDSIDSARVVLRPGSAYVDGYPITLRKGSDTLYQIGSVPVEFTSADFIRLNSGDPSGEGIALQFGGPTPVAAGTYSIIIEIREDLVTAQQDPFLRSANLNEATADQHRLVYDIHIVPSSQLDSSPMPYTGSAAGNFVNEVEITRNGTNYAVVSTTPITGSEAIDGRNLDVVFNNGNGTSTARFPISNSDLLEYRNGLLIDSNGTPYFITNMVVTPGNASRITMTIDLEKTRPLQLGTFQPNPVITDGIPYKLVKRDLYVTSSSSLPEGRRFFRIADVVWNGSSFDAEGITDLRGNLLARDGVLDLIQKSGLRLYSEGYVFWDATINGGYFEWEQDLKIHSVYDGFEWIIPAGDTTSLFNDALAQNEVLYVKLSDKPAGGSLILRKGLRGQGDLQRDSIQASNIFWIAKRHPDGRLYLNPDMIINDRQTKYFYDVPPERLVAQDILTLGYNTVFDDNMEDDSAFNQTNTTALYFANSYVMSYSTRDITISGNNITIPSACSFQVQPGDVVVQDEIYAVVVNVNSQTDFDVDDASFLIDAMPATFSQKAETLNLREVGDARERISSYYIDPIEHTLITYEDGEVQAIGNPIGASFSVTADGIFYTDALERPAALSQFNNKVFLPFSGLNYRMRFFTAARSGDGTSLLESFRAFMHERKFVGTLLPAVSGGGGGGGGGAGDAVINDTLQNPQAYSLILGRVVRMTPSGIDYADSSSIALGKATLGVLLNTVVPSSTALICTHGLAPNVLTGLGFSAGDEVYLGTNGLLVNEAAAISASPGSIIREIGVALNSVDLHVNMTPLEII